MRYSFVALLMLVSSVSAASAQGVPTTVEHDSVRLLATLQILQAPGAETRLSADDVLARLMTFDSDRDGRVATRELAERMQGLVARGDKSGDGALDESEIRLLATAKQFAVRSSQGSYGFGDPTLSSRSHIENSIDDLRLSPAARQEAMRIALAFVGELEAAAAANLRQTLEGVIPEQQLTLLEASLTRFPSSTAVTQTTVPARQQQLSGQMRTVAAAADAFRAERQFDEARQSELVARLYDVLTIEESDNLRAALARRPLVKAPGSALARIPAGMNEFQFRVQQTLR